MIVTETESGFVGYKCVFYRKSSSRQHRRSTHTAVEERMILPDDSILQGDNEERNDYNETGVNKEQSTAEVKFDSRFNINAPLTCTSGYMLNYRRVCVKVF